MMKGQILHQMNDIANARKFYAKGLENCRDSIPLWLLLARLEEDLGKYFHTGYKLAAAFFGNISISRTNSNGTYIAFL